MKKWTNEDKLVATRLVHDSEYTPIQIQRWARENGYVTDYEACRNFHKRVIGGQSAHRKEGSGRPVSLSKQSQGAITLIQNDPALSVRDLAEKTGISCTSVHKCLQKAGYHNYTKYDQVELNEKQRTKRYECAKNLLNDMETGQRDLSNMVFSDETFIPLQKPRGRETFWAKADRKADIDPGLVATLHSNRRDGLFIWGGANMNQKMDLEVFPGRSRENSDMYTHKILEERAIPQMDRIYSRKNYSLVQDWAPAHGSKETLHFLEEHNVDYLPKDRWPSNSPDLNPLDFRLWGQMKEKVYKHGESSNLKELEANVRKSWNDISQSSISKSIEELPERLHMVVDAKGGPIEGRYKLKHGK